MKLSTIKILDSIKKASAQKKLYCYGVVSRQAIAFLEALYNEGYINGFAIETAPKNQKVLKIELKYKDGNSVFTALHGVSKPSKNIYIKAKELQAATSSLVIQQTGLAKRKDEKKEQEFKVLKAEKRKNTLEILVASNLKANKQAGGVLLAVVI